jgi:hypothetical protein
VTVVFSRYRAVQLLHFAAAPEWKGCRRACSSAVVELELLALFGGTCDYAAELGFHLLAGSRRLVVLLSVSRNRDGTDGRVSAADFSEI